MNYRKTIMATKHLLRLFVILSLGVCLPLAAGEKPRLFVLTDIGGDLDDQMSMVRLVTYANHMANVKIGQVGEAVLTIDLLYEEGAKGDFRPIVRNVELDNVTSTASPRVLFIRGFPNAVIDDIRIRNSTFKGVTATEVVTHTGKIQFDNVTIEPGRITRGLNSVPAPATTNTPAITR